MTAVLPDRPEGFRRVAAALADRGHPHAPVWLDVPARTCAEAAAALGVSERTLARRLRAQGISFAELLDGVRRDAALQAVAQTTRALSDIALALGYAEPSVFTRAFRRWTGATPGQWRGRGAADMRAQPPAA